MLRAGISYAKSDFGEKTNEFYEDEGALCFVTQQHETIETDHLVFSFRDNASDQLRILCTFEVAFRNDTIPLCSWPYDYNQLKYIDINQLPSNNCCYLYFDYMNDPLWSGSANLLCDSSESSHSLLYGIKHQLSGIRLLKGGESNIESSLLSNHEYRLNLNAHIAIPEQGKFSLYEEKASVIVKLMPIVDYCYYYGTLSFNEMVLSYSFIFAQSAMSRIQRIIYEPNAWLEKYQEVALVDYTITNSEGQSIETWSLGSNGIPKELLVWLYRNRNDGKVDLFQRINLQRINHKYI